MRRTAILTAWFVGIAATSGAQARPTSLAHVFRDLFGPNGLVVNSEAVLPDGSTHSAHFNGAFQSNFTQFNIAIASQLTSLPLPSPASGFTYRFDAGTGTFVRSTPSFGPILTERAETIGRGRFSFGFTSQFYSFDQIEGIDLREVPAVFRHDDFQLGGGRADVVTTHNAIDASVTQWTGALTFGLTDRLDVSLAVPVVQTRLQVVSAATIQRVGTAGSPSVHFFRDPDAPGGIGSQRTFTLGGSAAGLGDLIVRVKGSVLHEGHRSLAGGLDLRAPTGDERDLLGSGAVGIRPFAAFSAAYRWVSPHANVGYQWNGSSVLAGNLETGSKGDVPDQVLFAVGADIGVTDRASVTVDWLGRRVLDSPRVTRTTATTTSGARSASFDDIAFERGSFTSSSAAFGIKTNLVGQLLVDFNLRFTLDDNGLTDRVTPLLGIEYSFQ
jgi:hypothetical protein